MKLFAPRASWDIREPGNFWGMTGNATAAGIRVDQATAMTFSAVFSATRIISETMATLPCSLLEQIDSRTTRKAIDHPLYSLMHDQPNAEQDIMSWIDSQVVFQVNWGNAYAEKQYDSSGNVIALWQIHPSRIPVRNIRRNGTSGRDLNLITVGQPGELVYYVNNDDGSATPIPASDMFHVPGVMTNNSITGQSIVQWAANSIGNALAAENHAGSIFKNGAVTNIALKHPKTLGEDAQKRLRAQWNTTYSGVQNHYKTLILEDGMEAVPINMNPEDTQLLATRQHSVIDIGRWYRMQPHMLGELDGSNRANIESEGISFITYTMLPWVVRWEKAMQRQLLTPEEKTKYRFKFNVNGLLRGDQAARGVFYQTMFNLGAYSPNDIREKEDENPIAGGDQYFIQGNNAVPLDKVGELMQANIDKARAQPPAPAAPAQDPAASAHHERLVEMRRQVEHLILTVEMRDENEKQREQVRIQLEKLRTESDKSIAADIVERVAELGDKLDEFTADVKTEISGVKTAVETQMDGVKQAFSEIPQPVIIDTTAETVERVSELVDGKLDEFTADMKTEIAGIKTDVESQIEDVKQAFANAPQPISVEAIAEIVSKTHENAADSIKIVVQDAVAQGMAEVGEVVAEAGNQFIAASSRSRAAVIAAVGELAAGIPVPIEPTPLDVDSLAQSVADKIVLPDPPVHEPQASLTAKDVREIITVAIDGKVAAENDAEKEKLAVEKDRFEAQKAEFEAKSEADRQKTDSIFALAIKREVDRLTELEWKWLAKASEKPSEWKDARVKYYQRFNRYFVANLTEYVNDAESLGITLDLEWGAKHYSDQSILDLKSLDAAAADNHHDRLKECVTHFRARQWTERSQTLAIAMVERGRELFKQKESSNA